MGLIFSYSLLILLVKPHSHFLLKARFLQVDTCFISLLINYEFHVNILYKIVTRLCGTFLFQIISLHVKSPDLCKCSKLRLYF